MPPIVCSVSDDPVLLRSFPISSALRAAHNVPTSKPSEATSSFQSFQNPISTSTSSPISSYTVQAIMHASSSLCLLNPLVSLVCSAFPTAKADLAYFPLRNLEEVLDEGPLETSNSLSDLQNLEFISIALPKVIAISLVVLCGLPLLHPCQKTHFVPGEVRMMRGEQSLKAMGKAFVTTSFAAGKHIANLESRFPNPPDLT